MPRLLLHLRNFLSFWRSFGFRGALDVGRGRKRAEAVYPVRVAACRRPLWVRQDSTDFIVLQQAVEFRRGFLPPGFVPKTVLDLGANTGFTASVFASRWPEARVIAVEPELSNFQLLRRNCEPVANVTAVHGAVWVSDGEVEIVDATVDAWGFQVGESTGMRGSAQKTPGLTVRTLMQRHSLETLDVVKMDIEGAEKAIFEANAESWLPLVRVLIIELHDRMSPGSSGALATAVAPLPHKRFKRGEYEVIHFSPTPS